MLGKKKSVTLYTAATPNGWKPSILLEELGVPYDVKKISLSNKEQKEDWYLKINPNGRIPALVDREEGDFPVFESGAILLYLCDRFDTEGKFLPKDLKGRYEVISWLMFQMGGVGPMQGQAHHFVRYAAVDIEYGKKRYVNETKRLYGVIDKQLEDKDWLAAGQYSIADMANFSWIAQAPFAGVSLDNFPSLKKWKERIESREGVKKGLDVPEPFKVKEILNDPEQLKKRIGDIRKIAVPTT